MKRVLKIASAVGLALVLVLAAVLPALAASEQAAPQAKDKVPAWVRGVVTQIDPDEEFFVIKAGEKDIKIEVNEGTKYYLLPVPRWPIPWLQERVRQAETELAPKVKPPKKPENTSPAPGRGAARKEAPVENPGLAPNGSPPGLAEAAVGRWDWVAKLLPRFGKSASFDDLVVNDRVVVEIVPRNGNPLAKTVLIIKAAAQKRAAGEVQEITDDSLKLKTDNTTITFAYDENTVFVLRGTPSLEPGMKAVVIYVDTADGKLAKRVTSGEPLP